MLGLLGRGWGTRTWELALGEDLLTGLRAQEGREEHREAWEIRGFRRAVLLSLIFLPGLGPVQPSRTALQTLLSISRALYVSCMWWAETLGVQRARGSLP